MLFARCRGGSDSGPGSGAGFIFNINRERERVRTGVMLVDTHGHPYSYATASRTQQTPERYGVLYNQGITVGCLRQPAAAGHSRQRQNKYSTVQTAAGRCTHGFGVHRTRAAPASQRLFKYCLASSYTHRTERRQSRVMYYDRDQWWSEGWPWGGGGNVFTCFDKKLPRNRNI